jgi:hypothetical protein
MRSEWLTYRTTFEQAEAAHLCFIPELGRAPVPFDHINHKWKALIAQMLPSDEIWQYSSSPERWKTSAVVAVSAWFVMGKSSPVSRPK